jgi:hypothetical protein
LLDPRRPALEAIPGNAGPVLGLEHALREHGQVVVGDVLLDDLAAPRVVVAAKPKVDEHLANGGMEAVPVDRPILLDAAVLVADPPGA